MVLRLQKLQSYESDDSSDHSTMSQDEAQPTVSLAKPSPPEQTSFVAAPPQTTIPPLLQTTIDEDNESSAGTEVSDTVSDDTFSALSLGKATLVTGGPHSLDTSFDEERSESVSSRRSIRRDRSHTWSHSNLTFKPARRSGSLTPMDSMMAHVPKLNLSEGRDSPYPASTPTCVSPHKYGKLLVCSEHRMSMSPRLPPIGCVNDLQSPRSLPKNTPRELTREVSVIDPALLDNADPTEVRMKGRRRNALMTPQPPVPEGHS